MELTSYLSFHWIFHWDQVVLLSMILSAKIKSVNFPNFSLRGIDWESFNFMLLHCLMTVFLLFAQKKSFSNFFHSFFTLALFYEFTRCCQIFFFVIYTLFLKSYCGRNSLNGTKLLLYFFFTLTLCQTIITCDYCYFM